MSRPIQRLGLVLALLATLITGCHPAKPFYFFESGDMSYYKGVATEIEYPDVESNTLAEVEGALPPMTVRNNEPHEIWDLTLEEAVQNTLYNSKAMRTLGGQVQVTASRLLTSPDGVQTIYDPAVIESNPRTGVEGALSAFDAQFSTSMFWERNERPQNVAGFFTGFLAPDFRQDLGTFQSEIRKTAATGGQFFLRNNTRYEYNNNPANLFPSAWNTNFEAEFRHPLLQGAGVQFNRIAGPNATPGSFTFGFGNGVILARINEDIALSNFEIAIRNLVNDVELSYWELYFAYRNLDTLIAGRDFALQTWRKVYALYVVGGEGGRAEQEAQAREQYYLFVEQVHSALNNLYNVEAKLRYIMGLAPTDGRLIRPADEPTTAKVTFDWFGVQNEGLARSAELRQQKWRVKRREMELIAAKNFLLPRLDAVGRYRWLGFGDNLINSTGNPSGQPFDNAFAVMTDGTYQEWQMGLQLSLPIGFRQPLAGVRNAQLTLARERSVLQDQELELAHQISDAIRNLEGAYTSAQDNFNRRIAARRQVESVRAAYDVGQVTLDLLLDAQRRLADAESRYFRSVVNYNLAVAEVHLRKGSLLEYNGVYLAEGPWPGKAYFDAEQKARHRSASHPFNYGFSRPGVLSRGVFAQQQYRTAGEPGPANPVRGAEPASRPQGEPVNPLLPPEAPQPGGPLPEGLEPEALPDPSVQQNPEAPRRLGDSRMTPSSGTISVAGGFATMAAPAGWTASASHQTDAHEPSAPRRSAPRPAATVPVAHELGSHYAPGSVDRAATGWQGVQR